MYGLYIDTHYKELVLALYKDGNILDKRVLNSNKHSENTLNLLNLLLNSNNLKVDDLSLIIVINGPGSFTGVRIGIVIAKILSYALNIQLKCLSYLEAMALNYNLDGVFGITDKNGIFVGEFKDGLLINDYYYLTKDNENLNKNIILDESVDLSKVYDYALKKESVSPYELKPLYVKKIEVEE